MKKNLIIIGSGPLALQISHYASLSGKYCVVGFLNDFEAKGTKVGEYEILGNLSDVDILYEKNIFDECFVAIGYNHFDVKDRLYHELKEKDIPLGTIIAPNVYIDPTSKIGDGCCIYPGCVIDMESVVEDNVIMNVSATIAHNSRVGANTFIAGGSILAGRTNVGCRCFIGVNATINDSCSICDDVMVGSATVIRKSIKKPGLYVTKEHNLHFDINTLNF